MIAIVDYGLGNIQAFEDIYRGLGADVIRASTSERLSSATRIILPGVGSFDWAMRRLNRSGLRDTLDELVLSKRVPVLGVCVGMQMMARRSEEGSEAGLGWLNADVMRFRPAGSFPSLRVPHMGWNDVRCVKQGPLLHIGSVTYFYFLHSYFIAPDDESDVLASASYGRTFTAAIARGNVMGTQFHPEKSHQAGVNLLRNFGAL